VISLVIGVVEALAGFYLPEGFKDIAAHIVVLVVLMVRPHGLDRGSRAMRLAQIRNDAGRASLTTRSSSV
jgi:hypothetical protein